MPWIRDGKCVYKKNADGSKGEQVKCHESESEAEDHLKALYASEDDDSDTDDKAVTVSAPEVVTPTITSTDTPAQTIAVTVAAADKALLDRIWDRFSERFYKAFPTLAPQPEVGSFRVFKDKSGNDRWMALYSNNFEDLEGELFSERGIDAFVQCVDMGVVPKPELWSWHTRGTRYGQADWVDRIGHFVVASGTYDDNEAGRTGKAYDAVHQKDYGVSHGFFYHSSGVRTVNGKRVYEDFNTFEISPLPRGKEANVFTGFAVQSIDEVKEVKMNAEKRAHLVAKFGEDYVKQLETETEKRGKAIEELAAYKDFVHPEGETESPTKGQKANTVPDDLAELYKEYLPAVVEDTGEAVVASLEAVKAVTALQKTVTEQAQTIKELTARIDTEFSGKPRRASKAAETVVDEDDEVVTEIDRDEKREKVKGALPGIYGPDADGE